MAMGILHPHRQVSNNQEADCTNDIYNECLIQIKN